MERNLLLGALALAVLGWLAGVAVSAAASPPGARPGRRRYAMAMIVIVVIAAKAAGARVWWPVAYPWDLGVAIGGLAALLGAWPRDRVQGSGARGLAHGIIGAAPMFLAVATTAAAAIWLRAALVETLLGIGAGWLALTLLLHVGDMVAGDTAAGLLPSLGFALTLPAAVALGTFRDAASQTATWSLAPILLAVGVPVLVALAGAADGRSVSGPTGGRRVVTVVVASAVLGGLATLIGLRLLAQPRFPMAVAAGLVLSLILWWLSAETAGAASWGAVSGLPAGAHVVSVLLTLAGVVAAFYLLIGYGVGIAMVAAWLPPALVALAPRAAPVPVPAEYAERGDTAVARTSLLLMLGVVILLYRLFVQRFDADLTGASLTDHFAIFTFVAGLFVPGLLARPLVRAPAGLGPQMVRLALVGLLMILVPATAIALWGPRAAVGLLAGFAAATALYHGAPVAGLIAAGTSLLLAQWGHHAIAITALTRDERFKLVLALGVATAGVLVVADVWTRMTGRSTPGPLATPEVSKGAHS